MIEISSIIACAVKLAPVAISILGFYISCSVFKFNHDTHAKQTLNLYIQRCNDATKEKGLDISRESLGTVTTSCVKACQYIEKYRTPLYFLTFPCQRINKKNELKDYLWDLLPFHVWEEIINRDKLKYFCKEENSKLRDVRVLRDQYNYLYKSLRNQIKNQTNPLVKS